MLRAVTALSTMSAPLLVAAWPAASVAQPMVCGDRAAMVESLARHYAEEPVAVGLDERGRLLEVLSAADGATWTVLVTVPDGPTCIMASGFHWGLVTAPVNDPYG
jgi:hypothetical protein